VRVCRRSRVSKNGPLSDGSVHSGAGSDIRGGGSVNGGAGSETRLKKTPDVALFKSMLLAARHPRALNLVESAGVRWRYRLLAV
jgi:hypothetical protein